MASMDRFEEARGRICSWDGYHLMSFIRSLNFLFLLSERMDAKAARKESL
jgi:hypothetical protein